MKYRKILSLHLIHDYFDGKKGRPFRFEITEDSEKQYRYYAQLIRDTDNGFFVLKNIDKIRDFEAGEHYFFDVAVYPSDNLFACYSDLEIDYKKGKVYYLSNVIGGQRGVGKKAKKGKAKDGESSGIHMTVLGGDESVDAVPVQLVPKQFNIPVDTSPGDIFKLLNKKNEAVKEWTIGSKIEVTEFYADMGRMDSGVYQLEKNGDIVSRYYADDRFCMDKPALVVGISLSLRQLQEGDRYLPREYEIRMASRSVYWRYLVSSVVNGRKIENLRIENNNKKGLPGVKFPRESVSEEKRSRLLIRRRDSHEYKGLH